MPFFKFSIPKCYDVQINTTHQSIARHLCIVGSQMLTSCEHLGSHNAEKLNNSWICFLGGPEEDRLGRNMSP